MRIQRGTPHNTIDLPCHPIALLAALSKTGCNADRLSLFQEILSVCVLRRLGSYQYFFISFNIFIERGKRPLIPFSTWVDVRVNFYTIIITHQADVIRCTINICCHIIIIQQYQQVVVTVRAGIATGTGTIEPQRSTLGEYLLTKFLDTLYDFFLFHYDLLFVSNDGAKLHNFSDIYTTVRKINIGCRKITVNYQKHN